MAHSYEIEGMLVKAVLHELEINYVVTKEGDYVCRLVPGEAGFELSPLDRAIGVDVPTALLIQINETIISQDA